MIKFLLIALVVPNTFALSEDVGILKLQVGYVTKLKCEGRLYLSASGNEKLFRLDALPKELGCGVILKPTGIAGRSNLILETSTGTIEKTVVVQQ